MDISAPADVACWWVEQALAVLDDSAKQAARGDFEALLDEFEGYWDSITARPRVELLAEPGSAPQELVGYIGATGTRGDIIAVTAQKVSKRERYTGHRRFIGLATEPVVHVPLPEPILPPARGTSLGADYFRASLDILPYRVRARVNALLGSPRRRGRRFHVLFSQPRPSGGISYFGVTFHGKKQPHPLLNRSASQQPRVWSVAHHHQDYQMPRGGACPDLKGRTVVVAGCGSVGGELARQLAHAGIGKLVLVDLDRYSTENVFRHVLPAAFLGGYKTQALKNFLEASIPGVEVLALTESIEAVFEKCLVTQADAVCLATGNPALERSLVRKQLSEGNPPMLLSAWVEALSLGGHAVVSRVGRQGCLDCLFHSDDGTPTLAPRTSFLRPGQSVTRELRGCSGAFTPYRAVDATMTASIATRLLLDALRSGTNQFYACWRGSDAAVRDEGLETTQWYGKSAAYSQAQVESALLETECRTCGRAS